MTELSSTAYPGFGFGGLPLWEKITAFDFDNPPSGYGFSIRLTNENFWTKDFTALAIVEYKKFS